MVEADLHSEEHIQLDIQENPGGTNGTNGFVETPPFATVLYLLVFIN